MSKTRVLARELSIVIVLGVALAGGVALVHGVPKREAAKDAFCESPVAKQPAVAWIKTSDAARFVHSSRVMFIDTRSEAAFARGHIAGAQRAGAHALAGDQRLLQSLRAVQDVIVYGETDGNCETSRRGAEALAQHIQANVHVLEGGFEAWMQAGLPAESGAAQTP